MNATKKLATAGAVALLSGVVLMIVLHQVGFSHFAPFAAATPWTHPMMGAMGWAMALGPLAMALWLGGIVGLAVALVRSVAEAA